ncbi:MAG: DUF1059 domain-containing protein [Armatimonadota bacterium]
MADKQMYSLSCKDGGASCDFHVCDSNQDEVVLAAQDHARRVHGMDLAANDIRGLVKSGTEATCH